ncbi:Putative auto-transporter adhesin, head GIN domain [Flagellimonas pacifica]|uniref:Putative auto-transporter adhesin, head GIN domain n=2 Tax=Flagellimonas pacifica TaxID=1247520 RepID=A0A285MCV5_9FLAO|nr:Putative auto-transporter adhesin, head GIN domain [Allomuricauda parva]
MLFLAFQAVHAQDEKITQELRKFTEVKGFDGLSINLIKSDVNKAVITGANTRKVAIVNNDGVLKLRMEIDKIFSGYRTFIDLYCSEELKVLDVNEDARIASEEQFVQNVLELKAQEGGELKVNCQTEQLLIKAVTGGEIETIGFSDNQDIIINTGGYYKGKGFKTKFTTITVNAGGNAEIYATNYVKANVKAGGEVLVYGDPQKMDEKKVFGGKIKRME